MGYKPYKIIWSPEAYEDYQNIISYLLQNWSEKVVFNFIKYTENKLLVLSNQPFIGLPSQRNTSVRSILLSSQNRLYYRVVEYAIELINIIDTRQNPKTKPF